MQTIKLMILGALVVVGAWCAEARYRPWYFENLTELPVTRAGEVNYVNLTASEYKVTGGTHTIMESDDGNAPKGALRVVGDKDKGVTNVTLWIEGPKAEIVATGRNGIGGVGGGAGIYLPPGMTLILRRVDDEPGVVVVSATGGNGQNAENGKAGGDASASSTYGDGGAGGRGGSAAGAGIGGAGGSAGAGGDPGKDICEDGKDGNAGGAGGSAGTLYVFDGIVVKASAGRNGEEGQVAASGGASWDAYGGSGGGGSGGGSGFSAKIGGGAGGGGGGGGGGCAFNHGASGGGGGAYGGIGGKGGHRGTGASDGVQGEQSKSGKGGAGGKYDGAGVDAGYGGAGGDMGAGGAGGTVVCHTTNNVCGGRLELTVGGGVGTNGLGEPSTLKDGVIRLDFGTAGGVQEMPATEDYTIVSADGYLQFPVQVPVRTGYKFTGYFVGDTDTKMFNEYGVVVYDGKVTVGSTFTARWEVIDPTPAEAMVTSNVLTKTATAIITSAPSDETTTGTWYYRQADSQGSWTEYRIGVPVDPLKAGDVVTINPAVLEDGLASGNYEFHFRMVSVCDGSGLAATNDVKQYAVFDYIRREKPTYDAAKKTVFANGSSLWLRRDTRETDRVTVFYDQDWDGVYEGALPLAYDLREDGWVSGDFADGVTYIGGGVKIWIESGYVYGVDMGERVDAGDKQLIAKPDVNYSVRKN